MRFIHLFCNPELWSEFRARRVSIDSLAPEWFVSVMKCLLQPQMECVDIDGDFLAVQLVEVLKPVQSHLKWLSVEVPPMVPQHRTDFTSFLQGL